MLFVELPYILIFMNMVGALVFCRRLVRVDLAHFTQYHLSGIVIVFVIAPVSWEVFDGCG